MKFKTIHDFLTAVQKNVDDRAVIAGGCLRDLTLGVKPKDVDIWVYNNVPSINPETLGIEEEGFEYVRSAWTPRSLSMISVTTVVWKGVTFDIIRLRDKDIAAVDRFDFGINQVWYDGKHIHTTPAFDLDVMNNTLTYLNTAENYLRLERIVKDRIPRMLEKFPARRVSGLFLNDDSVWTLPRADVLELRGTILTTKERPTHIEQIFLKVTEGFEEGVEVASSEEGGVAPNPWGTDPWSKLDKLMKAYSTPLYS